jgi:CheY-specific phosphatase CheX
MKMELIQPFINAADAVLAQGLKAPMAVGHLSMEEETYRRKGIAALVWLTGDIEGRIIFDLDPPTAAKVASGFAGMEVPETDDMVREAVWDAISAFTRPRCIPPSMAARAPKTRKRWYFVLKPQAVTYS